MHLDKEEVRKFYLEGYNAKQISNILKCNVEGVRKCIQRNLSDFDDKHKLAVYRRKDAIKAIDYEAKRYMSDKSFIMKNRSIYKTKPNGDIVIDKEVAQVVSWDTPKRLTNENKNKQ